MKRTTLFLKILFCAGTSFVYAQNFYLGVGTPADPTSTSCASCHSTSGIAAPVYNDWITTRHSFAQDSLAPQSFFGYDCLECHNTGWDQAIVNYGADEYVVQDTNMTPDYVITDQVNWDRVKNVQCEQCHGPLGTDTRVLGGDHWSPANTPNYDADVCGQCHQDSHHPTFEEWSVSKHSTFPSFIPDWTDRSVRGECYRCHHAQDYVAFISDPNYDPLTFEPDGDIVNITCVTCHDPHSSQFPGQLRKPISGAHVICDDCHTVDTEEVDIYSTPHHTTSECLSGTPNFGYQYPGETYENSVHTFVATERCINCHVNSEGQGQFGEATGHTFLPRTESCASSGCHPNYWDDPYVQMSDTSSWFNYRNVQHITDSLMVVLEAELMQLDPNLGHDESLGIQYNAALYNLESVQNAGSEGIHNTKLMQKLLMDAIDKFDPNDVEIEEGLPIQYELNQNFPNPFNPSTEIKFAIPERSNVKLVIYDAIGNEIETLLNEDLSAGNYKLDWNASGLASGVYLYRLQTDNFVATKKMILMK